MNIYYLFSFTRYVWIDRVYVYETEEKIAIWSLLKAGDEYFLNLWKDISFSENYNYKYVSDTPFQLKKKWFFSKKTINFIHFLVIEYFTTYKKIIPLFTNSDLDKVLIREKTKKNTPKYVKFDINYEKYDIQMTKTELEWQQLIVFPDIFTMENILPDLSNLKDVVKLFWSSTIKQKDEAFWQIKNWTKTTIISTPSQIFFDWKNLKKIILFDSHKWYYKSQQDPRYYVPTVLKKLAEIYWAEIEEYGFRL